MIKINGKTIHLIGKDISYIMYISENKDLINFHFGEKLEDIDYSLIKDEYETVHGFASNVRSLDVYQQEYPCYGRSDLREGAIGIENKFGNAILELYVKSYEVFKGVAPLVGMPSLYSNNNGETLKIVLEDKIIGVEVELYYTVFDEYNVIARNAVIVNKSKSSITLNSAYSLSIDLPPDDYEIIHYSGTWARERYLQRTPLKSGLMADIENLRGTSGHQMNPFVIIAKKDTDEFNGDAYGFSLIYSSNHATKVKVDSYGMLRVRQGINPDTFRWQLDKNESFYTPQSVMAYSHNGFNHLSQQYHDVYRNNLIRKDWAFRTRPIALNSWEGSSFNINETKILSMARCGKELGIELFVIDDGWFGKRDDETSSLGDWYANKEKLPSGIEGISKKIKDIGLMFGLWIEPEMISRNSNLFKEHPDWVVRTDEREPIEVRHQLILDLTKDEVCEFIVKTLKDLISKAGIQYIKWDMNRQMTDMPSLAYNHKYTLGLYKILKEITTEFPDVLFEGCCAGGGRFDAGLLAYMPQIWTSDNSDAIARLNIQYSTSMCYPLSTISNHVTVSPNRVNGRITPLNTRANVAYGGIFGYEFDVTLLTENEKNELKEQIKLYKKMQKTVLEGDFYRLISPYETNFAAWQVVSCDKTVSYVLICKILSLVHSNEKRLKLSGLDKDGNYKIGQTNKVYSGNFLMKYGIKPNFPLSDFSSELICIEKI